MTMTAASLTTLLLNLHRQPEPAAVLRHLLNTVAPAHGRAIAAGYLLDRSSGEFRLQLLVDSAVRVTPAIWRTQLQAPVALHHADPARVLAQFGGAGAAVRLTDKLEPALGDLWPEGRAAEAQRALGARQVALAPVIQEAAASGLLLQFLVGAWPAEVAGQGLAHAAVAIANHLDRQHGARAATDLFMRSVIEQVAERELNRAARYGRGLSIAVVGLPEDAAEERLLPVTSLVAQVMRLPDTAGRLDRARLVVVLPETAAAGAGGFVRRLRAAAGVDLATLRCATASYPNDGATWQELVDAALGRFRLASATLPATTVTAGVGHTAQAEQALAHLRVRLAPITEEEAQSWQALLARQPAVASIELESSDGLTATFQVTAPSVARLLAQLGQLAGKMDAAITPTLSGDIGINLTSGGLSRARREQAAAAGLR